MKNLFELAPTGIEGLDKTLGGGFVKGSVVLVIGHPGSGKTLLGATFIYNGLKKCGERGAYLSFFERKSEFYSYMKGFGMNFEQFEDKNMFIYMDALLTTDHGRMSDIFQLFIQRALEINAKRIVIDPISCILALMKKDEVQAFLHNVIGKLIKNLDATIILISEFPSGAKSIRHGIEEFIADTVIVMKSIARGDRISRVMEIRKTRGKAVEPFVLPYVITDKGLSVIPPLPIGIAGKFSGEKIESGIPILDKYLGGGFQRGSATLIAGPTGAGKTLLALKIAINNIKMGRKVLFFSLKESEEQLREYVKRMGTKEEEYKDKLWFLSLNPFSMSEYVILLRTREMINKLKPDLYIIDGLEMFNLALGLDKAINYGFRRIQELKSIGITVIITETSEEPYNKLVVAPFVDNVLVMEIVKDKMEYKKLLWILKLRGKPAPRTPLVIEDTEKGIELREL